MIATPVNHESASIASLEYARDVEFHVGGSTWFEVRIAMRRPFMTAVTQQDGSYLAEFLPVRDQVVDELEYGRPAI